MLDNKGIPLLTSSKRQSFARAGGEEGGKEFGPIDVVFGKTVGGGVADTQRQFLQDIFMMAGKEINLFWRRKDVLQVQGVQQGHLAQE